MTTPQFNIGDKVQWESQSSASWTTKKGTVHAIVHPNDNPQDLVPQGLPKSQLKFDSTNNTGAERYIVAVPRGGRSKLTDYYYPRNAHLTKQEDE